MEVNLYLVLPTDFVTHKIMGTHIGGQGRMKSLAIKMFGLMNKLN